MTNDQLMRKYILLLLLVMPGVCQYLTAQSSKYQFTRLGISQGLSHNRVNCIYKDSSGFVWFGTMSGLNRYDGYDFKVWRKTAGDKTTLADDFISNITAAPNGKLLLQTRGGLSIYDPLTENFLDVRRFFSSLGLPSENLINMIRSGDAFWSVYSSGELFKTSPDGKSMLVSKEAPGFADLVSDIKADSKGNIILLYASGELKKFDADNKRFTLQTDALKSIVNAKSQGLSLFLDQDNDAWIYSSRNPLVANNPIGVLYLSFETGQIKQLTRENGMVNNNIINGIVQDEDGLIWIGTDHGGINVLDKSTFKGFILSSIEDDKTSIPQNSIYALYKDEQDMIWLGTYKQGVCFYKKDITRFQVFRKRLSDPNSLPFSDVNKFVEDDRGNLWIGTNGGGLLSFNRQTNKFVQYKHDPANANSLSNDVIVSLFIDHEKKLWIGSYFGGLDCFDGKTFRHYRHSDQNPLSLSDDRVWEIMEDSKQNLWVGTVTGGLDLLDRKSGIFYHHRRELPNTVSDNYISSLLEDAAGNLWIGTANGIDVFDRKKQNFTHLSVEKNGLSDAYVISLFSDRQNNVWVGTRDGLNVYNNATKKFQAFSVNDGLPDKNILNILGDDANNLWVSTPNGISKITPTLNAGKYSISCQNYDERDGLQGRQFNENAAMRTSRGELIFGGDNGFNLFHPADIRKNVDTPALVFTELRLFNRVINPGDEFEGHQILTNSINQTKELELMNDENAFTIRFAALSFSNTDKNRYIYKLDGFNDGWIHAEGKDRSATYTNLDPGEYTFRVKASNGDGVWNDRGIEMKIIVLPPFWKTPLAYILYIVIAALTLFSLRELVIHRARKRFAFEQERKEAQRLHDLDLMKLKFITNLSHEFRTPLSLILTPLDKIIKRTHNETEKNELKLINRNGRRLLNMVNQLLDFRKMESSELRLSRTPGDIVDFIRETSYSFKDIAERKSISLVFNTAIKEYHTSFDHDKIERILFNLLSNAFKFTGEHGKVTVDLQLEKSSPVDKLTIRISDTGIGIPKENLEKIFERFYQGETEGSIVNMGSGIGLSIVREFVRLHEGEIAVESEAGKGSTFTIQLLLQKFSANDVTPAVDDEEDIEELEELEEIDPDQEMIAAIKSIPVTPDEPALSEKLPLVLLVDDNDDFREYLRDSLQGQYRVIEAVNGKEGWNKALALHPSLIVSDLNMPVMNGIELCMKVKNDSRTSFIPIIMLTAQEGEQQLIQGLQTGANDYVTKPFNFEVLLFKIQNLLKQQKASKQMFQKRVEAAPAEIQMDSPDQKFMRDLMEILEKNMSNAEFSVEEMSRKLYISRMGLYKKMLALTGKTPIEFIRYIRIKRAAQILEKSQMTISEVAYEVGFNNPKYFSKYFKMEYGVLPSVYQAERAEG